MIPGADIVLGQFRITPISGLWTVRPEPFIFFADSPFLANCNLRKTPQLRFAEG